MCHRTVINIYVNTFRKKMVRMVNAQKKKDVHNVGVDVSEGVKYGRQSSISMSQSSRHSGESHRPNVSRRLQYHDQITSDIDDPDYPSSTQPRQAAERRLEGDHMSRELREAAERLAQGVLHVPVESEDGTSTIDPRAQRMRYEGAPVRETPEVVYENMREVLLDQRKRYREENR